MITFTCFCVLLCLYLFIGEAVPEEDFVKISLRDISAANIAAEEMGGASGVATPPMSRQSSVASVTNSDISTHSHTTLQSLHNTTSSENNMTHIAIEENCLNGEIPSSAASPIHELKHSNNTNISAAPRSEDIILLEREREKLCAALDEKVCSDINTKQRMYLHDCVYELLFNSIRIISIEIIVFVCGSYIEGNI